MLKISKRNIGFTFLCIYFTGKMLWDRLIPTVLELFALTLIAYGILMYFLKFKFTKTVFRSLLLYLLSSIYIIINAIFQDTSQQLSRAIYEYIFFTAMLFSLAYFIKLADIKNCLRVVLCWGNIIAVLSWYEYFTRSYIIGEFASTYTGIYGFRAAVFSRSYLSHGMILGFFALIAFYLYCDIEKKRYLLSATFCFLSIFSTSSRGPLVATGIALLAGYLLNSYHKNKKIDKKILTWISLGAIGLIVLFIFTSSFETGNNTIDYFLNRTRKIINWTSDAGNAGRLLIWNKAIDSLKTNIWFGIGPSKTGSWGEGAIGVTESGVLKHLCELGILGFSFYYLYIFNMIFQGIKKYTYFAEKDKPLIIFYSEIIIMVLINNITLQSTEEIMVSFIFWLGMGGLLAMCTKYHGNELLRRK